MESFTEGLRALVGNHSGRLGGEQLLAATAAIFNAESRDIAQEPFSKPSPRQVAAGVRFERVESGAGLKQVRDRQSNLLWTAFTLEVGKVDFKGAEAAVAALGGDWRLPTIRELLTLVDYEKHDPAIDTSMFDCKSDWYWTSTPAALSPAAFAWVVGFYGGGAHWAHRDARAFVRAVRPSQ